MFTEALRELRHHPGRMVATLVAIAVSVGFLVGISMFVRTQGVALGKEQAVATSKADVVVDTDGAVVDPDEVTRTIKETQGVGAVDTVLSTSMPAAHGHDSVMIDLHQVPEEPFRWSTVKDGSWPSKADEVALSEDAAKQLQVSIGDTVAFSGHDLKVVGITDDPSALQTAPAYVGQLPGQAPTPGLSRPRMGRRRGSSSPTLRRPCRRSRTHRSSIKTTPAPRSRRLTLSRRKPSIVSPRTSMSPNTCLWSLVLSPCWWERLLSRRPFSFCWLSDVARSAS